jgi:hypothetical protein
LHKPIGRWSMLGLFVVIASAPWLLFFDPIAFTSSGHVARDPLAIYRVYSDDFAYVAASRGLSRTIENLFMPHNTHIVPAWRVLTWTLSVCAGSLERVPEVLAVASYAILIAAMILVGRLSARETASRTAGAAAAIGLGTTSLMLAPATWYSAGQPLWSGFATLAALWYAQGRRRSGSVAALAACAVCAAFAGWFWTIGYLAGPVAALYLWQDGRRACRWAAAAPLTASVLAALLAMALGAGKIDSKVSFHGRTTAEAARPIEGFLHTMQAVPESLVFGNLGLAVETTASQGALLTLGLVGFWAVRRLRSGGLAAFNSLEIAGAALTAASYLVEWTVRGYLPYQYLRTINVDMIVPWYHVVPHIGAVLFVVGWWSGPKSVESLRRLVRPPSPISRQAALGLLAFTAVLIALNRPRVETLWLNTAPEMTATEKLRFPIFSLQQMRCNLVVLDQAAHQRRHLGRLDLAERTARTMGAGLDVVRAAFGRLDAPLLPNAYDAVDLLDLPAQGRPLDPARVRQALAPYLFDEPLPRPAWLDPSEPWPPKKIEQPASAERPWDKTR